MQRNAADGLFTKPSNLKMKRGKPQKSGNPHGVSAYNQCQSGFLSLANLNKLR